MSKFYVERAKRGAEWLDKHSPGWMDRVDTDRLDVELCTQCVIGQVYGDYNVWHETKQHDFAISHGFHIRAVKDKNWQKQTKAWKKVIAARRQSQLAQAA